MRRSLVDRSELRAPSTIEGVTHILVEGVTVVVRSTLVVYCREVKNLDNRVVVREVVRAIIATVTSIEEPTVTGPVVEPAMRRVRSNVRRD